MDVGCANEFEAFKISYKGTGIFRWTRIRGFSEDHEEPPLCNS